VSALIRDGRLDAKRLKQGGGMAGSFGQPVVGMVNTDAVAAQIVDYA
jgi:hypothetical protein